MLNGARAIWTTEYRHGNDTRCALNGKMVKLHVKRGDESLFLYETTTNTPLSQLVPHLVSLFNGRLKVDRLCQGAYATPGGGLVCVN